MSLLKSLGNKTSMLLNLIFASNTLSSSFCFFFLIIDLYFVIPAVTGRIFHPAVEITMIQILVSTPNIAFKRSVHFPFCKVSNNWLM